MKNQVIHVAFHHHSKDVYVHIFMKLKFVLIIISLCLVSKAVAQNFSDLLSFQKRPDSVFLWYSSTHNMMRESFKKSIANSDSLFYTISNFTNSNYAKDKISYKIGRATCRERVQ